MRVRPEQSEGAGGDSGEGETKDAEGPKWSLFDFSAFTAGF